MLSYKDRTFCSSPNCKNDCNRKITELEKQEAVRCDLPVSYAYFCGEPIPCVEIDSGYEK